MHRAHILIGVIFSLAITVTVAAYLGQDQSATALLQHHAVLAAAQPIPALPSAPTVTAPQWVLYAGSIACLLIGFVMLWRCHSAGHCALMRRIRRPQHPSHP